MLLAPWARKNVFLLVAGNRLKLEGVQVSNMLLVLKISFYRLVNGYNNIQDGICQLNIS